MWLSDSETIFYNINVQWQVSLLTIIPIILRLMPFADSGSVITLGSEPHFVALPSYLSESCESSFHFYFHIFASEVNGIWFVSPTALRKYTVSFLRNRIYLFLYLYADGCMADGCMADGCMLLNAPQIIEGQVIIQRGTSCLLNRNFMKMTHTQVGPHCTLETRSVK